MECSNLRTVSLRALRYSGKKILVLCAYLRVIELMAVSWATCLMMARDFSWGVIYWENWDNLSA
jgi:hypothetical protein